MPEVTSSPIRPRRQVAVLPWRRVDDRVEFLLVTSRISRKWLLPKGWKMSGRTRAESAAVEAMEEAGVEGRVSDTPIGRYAYDKIAEDLSATPCVVSVYPMRVRKELGEWPEREQRERRWFTPDEASEAVSEPDLARLLTEFAAFPVKTFKGSRRA